MEARDELTDTFSYLLVSLFPVQGFPGLSVSDSTRFAYISHRPYTRTGWKADELLAFVVNPLIHADDNVSSRQARRGQLVPP